MIIKPKRSNGMHVALWIAQVILGVSLIWAALTKLVQPIGNLSAMWPWTGQIPFGLVKLTGMLDLAGGMGLILPSLLRIKPRLTPLAAAEVFVLMICACVFHILRGEASLIGVNIVFALMAAFIGWGRLRKTPISLRPINTTFLIRLMAIFIVICFITLITQHYIRSIFWIIVPF